MIKSNFCQGKSKKKRRGKDSDDERDEGPLLGTTTYRRSDCTVETRWVIPANGHKELVICFIGDKGKTEQKLKFGIVGTRLRISQEFRRYFTILDTLLCWTVCFSID